MEVVLSSSHGGEFTMKTEAYKQNFFVTIKTKMSFASCSQCFCNQQVSLVETHSQPVSVALIVSADACMQGVQGSNPTDD